MRSPDPGSLASVVVHQKWSAGLVRGLPVAFPDLELFSASAVDEDHEPPSPMPVGEPSLPRSPTCRSLQSKPETAISGELRSFAVSRLALPIARRVPQAAVALPDDR